MINFVYKGHNNIVPCTGDVNCGNGCCRNSPCLNGGTCTEVCESTSVRYSCSCPLPFVGKHCESWLRRSCQEYKLAGFRRSRLFTLIDDSHQTFRLFQVNILRFYHQKRPFIISYLCREGDEDVIIILVPLNELFFHFYIGPLICLLRQLRWFLLEVMITNIDNNRFCQQEESYFYYYHPDARPSAVMLQIVRVILAGLIFVSSCNDLNVINKYNYNLHQLKSTLSVCRKMSRFMMTTKLSAVMIQTGRPTSSNDPTCFGSEITRLTGELFNR